MSNHSQEKAIELKKIREEMIRDAEQASKKQRFALFSSPVPLGLGDDSMEVKKIPQRGENGKPITEPSNVKVSAPRTGRIQSSYFGPVSFINVGDPYVDPDKLRFEKRHPPREAPFRPASGQKELVGSAYKHMKDYDYKKVESRKQSDGRVYSAPKNVTTNPRCKVLDKSIPHVIDEYYRLSDFERKARMEAKKKEKEQAFKSTVYGNYTFDKDKNLYGETKMPTSARKLSPDTSFAKHEAAFRPPNISKGPFNKLIFDPPQKPINQAKRRFSLKKEKEAFRPADIRNWTKPNPTISCLKQNIRREMCSKGL